MRLCLFVCLLVVSSVFAGDQEGVQLTRPDFCAMGPASGKQLTCLNSDPTWTYNPNTNSCDKIPTGGCLETTNVFSNDEDCLQACRSEEITKQSVEVLQMLESFITEQLRGININLIIDGALAIASKIITKTGKDPMSLPDIAADPTKEMSVGFFNGSLSGISTLRRDGDWELSMSGITTALLKGGVQIYDVQAHYNSMVKFMGTEAKGHAAGTIPFINTHFDLSVNIFKCKAVINSFDIGEIAPVSLDVEGAFLLTRIIGDVTANFSNEIVQFINNVAGEVVKSTLGTIDMCSLF